MRESKDPIPLEDDLCIHTFTVSAAMVGVCLTVIGLIRIVITLQKVNTIADDMLAFDSVLFLTSCMLSYWALRTRKVRRRHRAERLADLLFLVAMVVMTAICLFITYMIATNPNAG
jgi:ABC-type xylose transport system permease subunit